jgi:hypothetical protein
MVTVDSWTVCPFFVHTRRGWLVSGVVSGFDSSLGRPGLNCARCTPHGQDFVQHRFADFYGHKVAAHRVMPMANSRRDR